MRSNFIFKKLGIMIIVLILTSYMSIPTFAAFKELNVPNYKQEKSQWCWATAAQMAGRYKYSVSSLSQTDIVKHVKGSDANETGTIWETENATEYVTNNTCELSATFFIRWNWDKIKTSIDNGYPVIPLVRNLSTGHYYVIRGYDEKNKKIAVNDPWDGTRYTCTWSDFDSGNWSHDSRPHKFTVYFDDYKN